MPWKTKADVARHNKAAAKSPKKARQWRTIANKLLAEGKPKEVLSEKKVIEAYLGE